MARVAPFFGAAMTLLSALPLAAQETDPAAALWEVFVTECSAIVEMPERSLAAALVQGDVAVRTPDGALATINKTLLNEGAALNAWISSYNEGRSIGCSVTWFDSARESGEDMSGIIDLAGAGAGTLLGGAPQEFGGPISAGGETGDMRLWALPAFPSPMSLSVLRAGNVAVLTLTRTIMPVDANE